jgi:hypothetical protein
MKVPLIGRAKRRAMKAANPVPVINETDPATGHPTHYETTYRPEHPAVAPAEDVLAAADWIAYNKAGRPYDKRTGKLISASKLAEHEV